MARDQQTTVFKGGCWPLTHSSLGFLNPIPFFTFRSEQVHCIFEDDGMCGLRQSSRGHRWLFPPPLSSCDLAISVHCEILVFAVFLNISSIPKVKSKKLDLWLCFAYSVTGHYQYLVLSQVVWQECVLKILGITLTHHTTCIVFAYFIQCWVRTHFVDCDA